MTDSRIGDAASDAAAHAAARAPVRRVQLAWWLLLVAGVTLVTLAGVPGLPERHAGDGSDALRLGWAERLVAEAQAAAAGVDVPAQPGEEPAASERR